MRRFNRFFSSLLFIGMGLLAVILFNSINDPKESPDINNEMGSSIKNPKPAGMKGFYLVLKIWHPEIKRWTHPLYALSEEAKNPGTLVIVDPIKPLSVLEAKALDVWISNGGLVVLMKKDDWTIKQTGYHQDKEEGSFWEVYGIEGFDDDEPFLLRFFEGGRLMVVPYVPFNSTLQENPALLVPVLQEILTQNGTVYFDEHHLNLGEHGGFMDLAGRFLKTKWGWVFLHLSMVFFISLYVLRPRHEKIYEMQLPENLSERYIEGRGFFLQELRAKEFCRISIENFNKYFYRRSSDGK